MLKGIMGIVLFVFFVVVFILMLTGGYIIRTIKKLRNAAQQAADQQERQFRDETGRQRQQYQYSNRQTNDNRQQAAGRQQQSGQRQQEQERPQQEEPQARRTQTATGETIIDHRHQERENKKIFDDDEGEYVEFTESS